MFHYMKILFVIVILVSANKFYSQNHHGGDTHRVVNFNITCISASQSDFNEAMILLHHMTYPQAREMFKKLAAKDSACAMTESFQLIAGCYKNFNCLRGQINRIIILPPVDRCK